ncbi:MAG: hypothetical protein ACTHMY_12825 [Solirubrobacteraceae bacterium]
MGKLGRLGLESAQRYERACPDELIHIDVKLRRVQLPGHRVTGNRLQRAGRTRGGNYGKELGTDGGEYVHIAVDDCTRLAYADVLPDENATSVVGFLKPAVPFYTLHGITVDRVLADNGSGNRSTIYLCPRRFPCRLLTMRYITALLTARSFRTI